MIFKIIIYFFLTFGIIDFFTMIWNIFISDSKENICIIIKDRECNELIDSLKKHQFKILLLSEDKNLKSGSKFLNDIHIVNQKELMEEICKTYGNNNRYC